MEAGLGAAEGNIVEVAAAAGGDADDTEASVVSGYDVVDGYVCGAEDEDAGAAVGVKSTETRGSAVS